MRKLLPRGQVYAGNGRFALNLIPAGSRTDNSFLAQNGSAPMFRREEIK